MTNSIGIIETRSVALAGEALNQILKIIDIELLNIEFPGEGFVTAFLFGEYSKMKDALETANNLSASFSTYFSKKIITKPDEKLFE
ncbi:MAG: BMC domain-containing protein, partial [Ignavibacteriaceae bacterium]|nr:BMC domain-containing protein [Ignavibacteriaceae bacterium]